MAFNNPSFYDAPGMLAQQAVRGNLDVRNTLLNPDALSPSQRQTLYEAGSGGGFGNRLVDTLGHIITNPFTYLLLLTGPMGGKALQEGKSLLAVAANRSPYVKERLGVLASIGVMDPLWEVGQEAEAVTADIAKHTRETMDVSLKMRLDAEKPLIAHLSSKFGRPVTSLNGADYANKEERDYVQTLVSAAYAKLHELDQLKNPEYQEMLFSHSEVRDRRGRLLPGIWKPQEGASYRGNAYIAAANERVDAWQQGVRDAISEINAEEQRINRDLEMARQGQVAGDTASEQAYLDALAEKDAFKKRRGERLQQIDSMPYDMRHHGDISIRKEEGIKTMPGYETNGVDAVALQKLFDEVPEALQFAHGMRDVYDYQLIRKIGDETRMLKIGPEGRLMVDRSEAFVFDEDKVRRFLDHMRKSPTRGGDLYGPELLKVLSDERMKAALHETGGTDVQMFKKIMDKEIRWGESRWFAPRNAFVQEKILSDLPGQTEIMGTNIEGRVLHSGRNVDREVLNEDVDSLLARRQKGPEAGKTGVESDDIDTIVSNSSLTPRTNLRPDYSSDSLAILHNAGLLNKDGENMLKMSLAKATKAAARAAEGEAPGFRTISLDHGRTVSRATRESAAIHAYVTAPSEVEFGREVFSQSRKRLYDTPVRPTPIETSGAPETEEIVDPDTGEVFNIPKEPVQKFKERTKIMEKGDSNARALELIHNALPASRQAILRNMVIPVALGIHNEDSIAVMSSLNRQKDWMGWLANSWIGKSIEEHGGKSGKEYVQAMRHFANPEMNVTPSGTLSEKAASYLYLTHMGFNLASVTLNMLQPLTNAASIGNPMEVMAAYGKAFKSVFGYMAERTSSGRLFANALERNALIKKHLPYAEEMGLTEDFMKTVEANHLTGKEGPISRLSRLSMSLFEKSEWFNKMVSANIMESRYLNAGQPTNTAKFFADLRSFIANTQFSANALYRPMIFNRQQVEGVKTGILSNPLWRMFLQFPLRTATTFFVKAPQWGGEENYLKGLFVHAGRALGYGAIVNEVARGMFHADVTRGLPASSVTDIIGGNKFMHSDSWYPVPPILRIPVQMIRGVMGDQGELAQAVSTLVPGGVAVSRALSAAPQLPMLGGGIIQKNYVDYKNVQQDGTVPIYKPDGSLIGYDSPTNIILKGLGVDLGSGQQQGQIDGYLIKQRQEIINYRQEFLRRMAGNDMSGAEAVRREFSAKYKDPTTGAPLPLTVTQSQVKQYLRSRDNIGRTERILDSLSPDVRMQMANAIGGTVTTGSNLVSGMTAGQRQRYNPAGRDQMVADIYSRVQSVGAAATGGSSPVGPAATSVDQGP